jgi:hypothetical protein
MLSASSEFFHSSSDRQSADLDGITQSIRSRTSMIRFEGDDFEIDAVTIADALGIQPSLLQQRIRDGALTTRCERGVDADEGRYRLTFFTRRQRLRLIVDAAGNVLQRSLINFGKHPARRPSGRNHR